MSSPVGTDCDIDPVVPGTRKDPERKRSLSSSGGSGTQTRQLIPQDSLACDLQPFRVDTRKIYELIRL